MFCFMYVCMCVCIYIYVCVCVCVCVCIYIYKTVSCLLIKSIRDFRLSKLTRSMLAVKYHFQITNDKVRCIANHSSNVILNLFFFFFWWAVESQESSQFCEPTRHFLRKAITPNAKLGKLSSHCTWTIPTFASEVNCVRHVTNSCVHLDSWTLKMGPTGCQETSVRNYYNSLRNNPEERSSLVSTI